MSDELSLREHLKESLVALAQANEALVRCAESVSAAQLSVQDARGRAERALLALTHVSLRAKEASDSAAKLSTLV